MVSHVFALLGLTQFSLALFNVAHARTCKRLASCHRSTQHGMIRPRPDAAAPPSRPHS